MLLMGSAERINTTYLEWVKETLLYEIFYHLDTVDKTVLFTFNRQMDFYVQRIYSNMLYDRRGSLEFSLNDFL